MVYSKQAKRSEAVQLPASGSRLFAMRQTLSAKAAERAAPLSFLYVMSYLTYVLMVLQKSTSTCNNQTFCNALISFYKLYIHNA
jgi:hypothetical protein